MKEIPNFENYLIDENGLIYSKLSKKYIKPFLHRDGYLRIGLYSNGTRKEFQIHRLVALVYLPNPDNLPQVNHKDENKLNNNVNNLEWCDRKTNLELSSVGFTRNKFKCYIEEVSSGKNIKEFETIKSACEWASENLGCSKSYLQRKTGNISNGYRVMKV